MFDSRIANNVAKIQSPAERVSGGAVYAANGAEGLFSACAFRANSAGGLGYYDRKPAAYLEQSQARLATVSYAQDTYGQACNRFKGPQMRTPPS